MEGGCRRCRNKRIRVSADFEAARQFTKRGRRRLVSLALFYCGLGRSNGCVWPQRGGSEGSELLLNRRIFIERRTLSRQSAQRADYSFHFGWRHFFAVHRSGRASNAFVHKGAADVVCTRAKTPLHTLCAHLDPRRLNIRNMRMQSQSCDRVHQHRLAKRRATA